MIDPDFRLSDDDDAWLDLYEAYLAHWLGVFHQPASSSGELAQHLFIIEFALPGTDAAELLQAFQNEFQALSRRLAAGDHLFGLAYLLERSGGLSVCAVVLVHPDAKARFEAGASGAMLDRSRISIRRSEVDVSYPETPWRWLIDELRKAIDVAAGIYRMPVVLGL